MRAILKMIDGYKTAIGFVAAGLLSIALQAGWVEPGTAKVLGTMIVTWTGVAVADKGNKIVRALRK